MLARQLPAGRATGDASRFRSQVGHWPAELPGPASAGRLSPAAPLRREHRARHVSVSQRMRLNALHGAAGVATAAAGSRRRSTADSATAATSAPRAQSSDMTTRANAAPARRPARPPVRSNRARSSFAFLPWVSSGRASSCRSCSSWSWSSGVSATKCASSADVAAEDLLEERPALLPDAVPAGDGGPVDVPRAVHLIIKHPFFDEPRQQRADRAVVPVVRVARAA